MKNPGKKVIVIGGGAAGIAAAIEASKAADVTVLEHMDAPLIKLLITGNGRCNFSNTEMTSSHYHGDRKVIENVLSSFTVDDCLDFMEECGVEPLEVHYRYNDRGYFYPSTNQAKTVRDGMLQRLNELGGKIRCRETVKEITGSGNGYLVSTESSDFQADSVIFACGSNAAPETGSDSSIYPVLKELGVKFHTFLPALSGIKVSDRLAEKLRGMRCTASVSVSDLTERKKYSADDGEVQFGNGYLSGIPVLELSRYVSIGKKAGHQMHVFIVPHTWENVKKEITGFPETIEMECTGTRNFSHAQCCLGGVDTGDLNPDTLEFKNQKGIYFCGEMIDIDGDCGGYNLHFAFGSGKMAGKAATK